MTLPLWGQLQLSADDPRTIAEYIADILEAHNADNEAHLVEGGSLALHKAETVIDHPQGSVLADKWTNSEFDFTTTFENLANFAQGGDYILPNWPGFALDPSGAGWANRVWVGVDGEGGGLEVDFSKDALFQLSMSIEAASNGRFVGGLGPGGPQEVNFRKGIGFYIAGNTLKFFVGNAAGTTYVESDSVTMNDFQSYILRIFNNSVTGKVECYVDGELIDELTWPVSTYVDYADVVLVSWSTSGGGSVVDIKSMYYSILP